MHASWNLFTLLILGALCGQSAAFWPFRIFAATDSAESAEVDADVVEDGIKRIAIIGMLHSSLLLPLYKHECFKSSTTVLDGHFPVTPPNPVDIFISWAFQVNVLLFDFYALYYTSCCNSLGFFFSALEYSSVQDAVALHK